MTLLETLALLTLLATVGFGAFDIAYKIFHNKNDRPQCLKPERSFFVTNLLERC